MKKKIVAFDLDGTLINSAPDITHALNAVLYNNNLKMVTEENVRNLIGNGAKALIIQSFNKQNKNISNLSKLVQDFLDEYKTCFMRKTKLYENVLDALRILKENKIKLILVSNKPEYYVEKLIKHFNLELYFSSFSGGDTFNYRKPDSKHLLYSINKANIYNNYIGVFVGDSKYDLECANNSNWPCVLYSNGYSDIDIKLLKPTKIFNNYRDLPEIINKIFSKYFL